MDLKNLVYGIYGLINYKRTDVFAEYEKIPVKNHDDIYIVTSIENISLKNQFIKSSLKRYETLIRPVTELLYEAYRTISQ